MEHYYRVVTNDEFHDGVGEDELKHYGVKGMHWGIRRYQPYTSNPRKGGKTGKFIGQKPKTQKDSKGSVVGLAVGLTAAGVVGAKVAKAVARNKQEKKIVKKGAEKAMAEQREKEHQEYLNKIKNRDWNDHTKEERDWAYKKEEKTEMMNAAKKEDKYNLDFLETIQNDWFLSHEHPDAEKTRHAEYKKFLDNPMRYMSTHSAVENPPKAKDSKSADNKGSIGIIPAAAAVGAIVGGVRAYNSPAVQQKRRERYMEKANKAKTDEEHDKWNRKAEDLGQKMYNKALKKNKGDITKTNQQMRQLAQQQKTHQRMVRQANEANRTMQEAIRIAVANHQDMVNRQMMTPFMGSTKKKKNYRLRAK